MAEITEAEAAFDKELRFRAIERLKRLIRFLELNAPQPILDAETALIFESMQAILGGYGFRRIADNARQRAAIAQCLCMYCYRKADGDFCSECAAKIEKE